MMNIEDHFKKWTEGKKNLECYENFSKYVIYEMQVNG